MSPSHRCELCGCKLEDHKGGADKVGPFGRCPAIQRWGLPHPFPSGRGKTDEEWDAAIVAYWRQRSSIFKPLS